MSRFSSKVAFVACALTPFFAGAQSLQFGGATNTMGNFSVSVTAPLGRTYVIQASTNLSAWNPILTNIAPSGPAPIADTNASALQLRFYRGALYYSAIVPNTYSNWQTTNTGDGRHVTYPGGWLTARGTDGRVIAYPTGWSTTNGPDGRLIAFPSGFTNKSGGDGRAVAFYSTGFTNLQGPDGRLLAYPSTGWTNLLGQDGRRVALPLTNFLATNGTDGRITARYSSGWTNTNGLDGRAVFYPVSGFAISNAADGRLVSYPTAGWAATNSIDGRLTAAPTNTASTINLNFQDQSLYSLFGALQPVLSATDFNNYIIYTFFGAGDQQFAD